MTHQPRLPRLPRRLATAAVTIAALGASAAPALAATTTPTSPATKLGREIQNVTPGIMQNVQIQTPAQERAAYPELLSNAGACRTALTLVDQTAAPGGLASLKREWVSGVNSQITADEQISAGLLEELSGQQAVGHREVRVGLAANNRADLSIAKADNALGVR